MQETESKMYKFSYQTNKELVMGKRAGIRYFGARFCVEKKIKTSDIRLRDHCRLTAKRGAPHQSCN